MYTRIRMSRANIRAIIMYLEKRVFPHRLKYSSIRPTKHLHIERREKRECRKYSRIKKKESEKIYKKGGNV